MNSKQHLQNSTAVITGGSSGIGWAISKKLSSLEATTAIIDKQEPPAEYEGVFIEADLKEVHKIDDVYDAIINELGNPDVLILNAGRGIHEKLTEGDPDLWENTFQLNLFSNLRLIRAFTPGMMESGSGDIIFTSSVSARKAFPYGGIYGASKAALDMIAETLRLEVQPTLRVTTLHPGIVDTNFFENIIHGTQTPENIGWGAIDAEQIAELVIYALNQPQGITLNDLVIRPTGQPL